MDIYEMLIRKILLLKRVGSFRTILALFGALSVLLGSFCTIKAEEPNPVEISDVFGGQNGEWAASNATVNKEKIANAEAARTADSVQISAGYVFLNVPIYAQLSADNCVPASAQMLLKSVTGITYNQWDLATDMYTVQNNGYGGTLIDNACNAINNYISSAGINLVFGVGNTNAYSIENAFQYTRNQGYPVIPYVQMYYLSSTNPISVIHAICVRGYNYTWHENRGLNSRGWSRVFYYNDPYQYNTNYYGLRSTTCETMETAINAVMGSYGYYIW